MGAVKTLLPLLVLGVTAACRPAVPEAVTPDASLDAQASDAEADGGAEPSDAGPSPAHPDWPPRWSTPALPARNTIVAVLYRSVSEPLELAEVDFALSEPVRVEVPSSLRIWNPRSALARGVELRVDSLQRVHLSTLLWDGDGGGARDARFFRSFDLRTREWVSADLEQVPFDGITANAWELGATSFDDRFVLWGQSRLDLDNYEVLSVAFDGTILGSVLSPWRNFGIGPGGYAYAHYHPYTSTHAGVLDPDTLEPIAECPRYVRTGPTDVPPALPPTDLVDVDGTYVQTQSRYADESGTTWLLQWRRLCSNELVHEIELPREDGSCSRVLALARDHVVVLECDLPPQPDGLNRTIFAYDRDGRRFLFPRLRASAFLAAATDRLER